MCQSCNRPAIIGNENSCNDDGVHLQSTIGMRTADVKNNRHPSLLRCLSRNDMKVNCMPATRHGSRAQVMPLFALMLPVIIALLGLTMSGEIYLNARSRLDAATVVAVVAASGDACMASQYTYDEYECQYGTYPGTGGSTTSMYANGLPPYSVGMESPSGSGILTTTPSSSQITEEQQLASYSAESSVKNVLEQAFPGYTINAAAAPTSGLPCQGTESGSPPYSTTECSNYEQGSSLTNIEFQVLVSPNYMLYDNDPSSGTADDSSGADGDESSGPYVCPATNLYARQVTVNVWMQASQPFGVFIGESHILMQSTQTGYGCLGN